MVAPWDSHRSRPQGWNSEDEFAGGKDPFSDPPHTNFEDFSIPEYKVDQTEFDLPSDGPVSATETDIGNSWGKTKLPRQRHYPVAFFAVAAGVAILAFLGLRLINVSFGSNSDLADGTELPIEGETTETVPAGTTQTTLGSIASGATNWDDIARSVVYFEVGGGCQWVGSGTLILDGSYVLTNWHVSGGG